MFLGQLVESFILRTYHKLKKSSILAGMSVVIVDYGVGNLRSVYRALQAVGITAHISNKAKEIRSAKLLILPGQGAFATAMEHLQSLDLVDSIKEHVLSGRPYLGICLGFQLLFTDSFENGHHKGLGIFPGSVCHFDSMEGTDTLSIPHMGWNTLDVVSDPNTLFKDSQETFYFVHSYAVKPMPNIPISTQTTYGSPFISSVQQDHLLATQFHPEKSGNQGLELLRSFFQKIGYLNT